MRILTLNEQGLIAGGRMVAHPEVINAPGVGGDGGVGGDFGGGGDLGDGDWLDLGFADSGASEGYIGDQTLDIYSQGYTEITNTTNTPETITCEYHTDWGQLADGILDEAGGAVLGLGAVTADGFSWGTLTAPALTSIVVGYGMILRGQNLTYNARYKICKAS